MKVLLIWNGFNEGIKFFELDEKYFDLAIAAAGRYINGDDQVEGDAVDELSEITMHLTPLPMESGLLNISKFGTLIESGWIP